MQPCFPLSEVQHVNSIDRSFGVIFARWGGLGILSMARIARSNGEGLAMLLDPIPGVGEIGNQSHATSCTVGGYFVMRTASFCEASGRRAPEIRLSERIERTEA
jgi:hypothetical protein